MSDTNKDFSLELIKQYGIDRFYHCCFRTGDSVRTTIVYMYLNENSTKEDFQDFFTDLKLDCQWIWDLNIYETSFKNYDFRQEMCGIAYGFSRYWKEYGLKTYKLPDHLHLRMILGEKNEWVKNYINWIEENKS